MTIPAFSLLMLFPSIHACRSDNSFKDDPRNSGTIESKPESTSVRSIYIQPLGKVKESHVKVVATSVKEFYGFNCVVRDPKALTQELLADSRKRYSAQKILQRFNGKENIFILMEKDIAVLDTDKVPPEWGVIGLGYRPGTVCVVSTYRLNLKRNVSEKKVEERLRKVAIHEI